MDNAYARGQKLICGAYTAYTPTGKDHYVKAGRWFTSNPQVGDDVYFYSTSLKRVAHVGRIIRVSGTEFWTVEGNTSGAAYDRDGGEVATKHYTVSDGVGGTHHINGFGRPIYGDDTCTAEEMVKTLLAEVGYGEKATNANLESKSANVGNKNFTKYGKWIGQNGEPWCQSFQCWCAWQACAKHLEQKKTGWRQEDGGWRWYENDICVCSCWKEIGGFWYAFDSNGLARTGWWETPDGWYYFDPATNKMLASQWLKYKDNWYYLTRSGIMATSAYAPDNGGRGWCWMHADGTWNGNYNMSPESIYDKVS